MFKYLFKKDTLFATAAVFILIAVLGLIPLNTHILDPFKIALRDFDYNDMAFSRMGKNANTTTDTSVIIVNIGNLDRPAIANLIENINTANPKVIGVDVLFETAKNPQTDSLLRGVLMSSEKIVMAYNLISTESPEPSGYFYPSARNKGYANFVGEEEGVIRYYTPEVKEGDKHFTSFSGAVTGIANPEAYKKLLKHGHEVEMINYRYSPEKYIIIQGSRILDSLEDKRIFENKIVLLGYVSLKKDDIEDKHYTPMNSLLRPWNPGYEWGIYSR